MLSSIPVRRSQRLKDLQSNQIMTLQNSRTTELEKKSTFTGEVNCNGKADHALVNINKNPKGDREDIHEMNTLLSETVNRPIGRAANLGLVRPGIGINETASINESSHSGSTEIIGEETTSRKCHCLNVPACSESIGASVLQMVNTFDDEISSAYFVQPRYARTFGSILEKHGDITRDCSIKASKTFSSVLEKICETVQDLEVIRFVDLRRNHLCSMLSAITDAEHIKLDVKWLRNRYEELAEVIDQLKQLRNLKDRRKEVDITAQGKRDEITNLQSKIEMLKSEVVELNSENERLRIDIKNVTSKCRRFCKSSLMDGLV